MAWDADDLVAKARKESRRCHRQFVNNVFVNDKVNEMLQYHAALLDALVEAVERGRGKEGR